MKIKDIIKKIHAGLSGDTLSDLNYLKSIAEEYNGHPLEREILEELSQVFLSIVAKEEDIDLNALNEEPLLYVDAILDEVETLLKDKNLNEALNVCEECVLALEASNPCVDDENRVYKDFASPIEEIVYISASDEKREIVKTPEKYSVLYKMYGNILFELENYEEAKQAFIKALHYNPVDFEARFEYIRTFNYLNDNDTFLEETDNAFPYAYTPHQLSHLFLNLGFYYLNIQYYDIAVCCLYCSLSFERENSQSENLLVEIMQETKKEWAMPSQEEIAHLFEEYEIPVAPNRKLLKTLYSFIIDFKEVNADFAYYLCEHLYKLTPMEEIKNIMEEIRKKDEISLDMVSEEEFKNGSILNALVRKYHRSSNEETLYDVLYALNKATLIVPAYSEDLGYEDGMHPDVLKNDAGKLFLPVFSNEEEMPKDYASHFSFVHARLSDCIESAKRLENVDGIVLNAFSYALELPFEKLSLVHKMNQQIMN